MTDPQPPGFWDGAACTGKDPDIWFDGHQYAKARRICFTCPIRRRCLEFAERNGEAFGMWGGRTPEERGYNSRNMSRSPARLRGPHAPKR